MNWQPIETAPRNTREMFVVKAFNTVTKGGTRYTSDAYCVWSERGKFVRWPHEFQPTHWMPLPPAPADGVSEPANPWKEAVLDQLANCCMDAPLDESPRSILRRVIRWHEEVALDPNVSEAAQDLIKQGAAGVASVDGGKR